MRKLLLFTLLIFSVCNTAFSQDGVHGPNDSWHRRMWDNNKMLRFCMMNVGCFPAGFYWIDIHGHTWLIESFGSGKSIDDPICKITFVPGNFLDEAAKMNLEILHEADISPYIRQPNETHPPVILQNGRFDRDRP